jgi:hypothetical protein
MPYSIAWYTPSCTVTMAIRAVPPGSRALLCVPSHTHTPTHAQARIAQQVGASLEARVLLHVGDPALASALKDLDSRANGVDELRTLFIVSQVCAQWSPVLWTKEGYIQGSG